MPPIHLVVFDLGRVLLKIVDDFDHACVRAGLPRLVGFSGDLSILTQRNTDPAAAELFDGFETGRVGIDDYARRAAAITRSPAEQVLTVLDACLIHTFPGAADLLDRLAPLPVQTACLSNTNARHWQLITDPAHQAFLPVDRFDHAFASHLVGHAKPHDAVYRHVEEAAGVAPEHILFFDDIPENTDAARSRGWHAQLVDRDTDNPVPAVTETLAAYGVLEHA